MLLLSMVAHEYGHAWAALKQGDDTAEKLGRITWNPIKHIDPFFTIAMPVLTFFLSFGTFAFGGAKPVPVDPTKFRSYVRGDIIVSLAGVTANLVLAIVFAIAIVFVGLVGKSLPVLTGFLALMQGALIFGIFFNILLLVFNLIPIPPLDGSHVFKHLLPPKLALHYQRLGAAGLLVLLGMFWIGGPVPRALLSPVYLLTALSREVWGPFLLVAGGGA